MTTIALLTLGCKLNYAETSTYERGFVAAGWRVVPWEEGADVFLVNTCSVTQHSDNKCRNIIRKCHRTSPAAKIVVTGCYAELRRDEIKGLEGVSLVFGSKEKRMVVPDTIALVRGGDVRLDDTYKGRSMAEEYRDISGDILPAWSGAERTRSFLKVQDGCDYFCAYCTIGFARGRSRNIPIATAVEEAGRIAASGTKEIVITGVNTGDFGRTTGESFLALLQALEEVDGIERYRISSMEPNLLTDEIIDWIAGGTKFQPHFHVPLQTGSDVLLREMGRRYDTAFFASKIDYIRSRMGDGVFFGIDVMAGLPGETDGMFSDTYSFLAGRVRPSYIHVFPYSRRPGTRADKMPCQVKDSVKTERVAKLQELCDSLHEAFLAANKGKVGSVLWEAAEHDGLMSGYTGNYIRVSAPYDPSRVGIIEEVTI